MLSYVNGSQHNSISGLENSIRRSNEQMERMQQRMFDEEDRLYKKFAALETALSKLQSQSDWMMAMLNANNGNNNNR
jgi:flagellar hook-associated protein 2